MNCYHPDPEINALVELEAIEAEKADLAAGFPPSWWMCPDCGASHQRGHFGVIGSHRCLNCGYAGSGGVMAHTREELAPSVARNGADGRVQLRETEAKP